MNDEVRAAAERFSADKYRNPAPGVAHAARYSDAEILADAFLPYLDESPITEDVLREMGFRRLSEMDDGHAYHIFDFERHTVEWFERDASLWLNGRCIADEPTVGQLRMLLDVLGAK